MKTIWTSGLKVEEKKEITQDFKSSPALRARLVKILDGKIGAVRAASLSKDSYLSPSWAYQQADAVGYERALREVISLFDEKDVEK